MLFRTKLFLSLGILGVAGGTSTGVYYLKNKDSDGEEDLKKQEAQVRVLTDSVNGSVSNSQRAQPSSTGGTGSGQREVGT